MGEEVEIEEKIDYEDQIKGDFLEKKVVRSRKVTDQTREKLIWSQRFHEEVWNNEERRT